MDNQDNIIYLPLKDIHLNPNTFKNVLNNENFKPVPFHKWLSTSIQNDILELECNIIYPNKNWLNISEDEAIRIFKIFNDKNTIIIGCLYNHYSIIVEDVSSVIYNDFILLKKAIHNFIAIFPSEYNKLSNAIRCKIQNNNITYPKLLHNVLVTDRIRLSYNDWTAIEQADFIYSLRFGKVIDNEIKTILGISTPIFEKMLDVYYFLDAYRKHIYYKIDVPPIYFAVFNEALQQPKIKTWLDWNSKTRQVENIENLNRFFAWISPKENLIEDGDKGNKIETVEALISTTEQIKQLAKFINDDAAVQRMEQAQSLQEGYLMSEAIDQDRFSNALNNAEKQIETMLRLKKFAPEDSQERLFELQNKLIQLLQNPEENAAVNTTQTKKEILLNLGLENHLSELTIHEYKGLKNVHIANLRQFNVFAGENNSGKSTLLEVIYALITQNDINDFLEIQRRRAKFIGDIPSIWLEKQFPNLIDISGVYMGQKASVRFEKALEQSDFDKTGYISTIFTSAKFGKEESESKLRLFDNKNRQLYYSRLVNITHIQYANPFAIQQTSDMLKNHEKSVQSQSLESVISFLKSHIDSKIQKIDLVNEAKDLYRFLVTQQQSDKPLDITQFGDGLQRIFYISLQFSAARNGLVLIDEVENAIHHDLFVQFIGFIRKLAAEFNVQVFLTSHSKECIDAIFNDEEVSKNTSAYQLKKQADGNIACIYEEGARYSRLIKKFGADLRGGKS
jgi:AAA15 family ATPase/GTPase